MRESPIIIGKIIILSDTHHLKNGFQKREFVVETDDKYPQRIKFETIKDGCDRLDQFQIGDYVSVSYNLRGNEYNGKYYISAQAWKFERVGGANRPVNTAEPRGRRADQNGAAPPPPPADDDEDDFDDVPF